MKLLNQNFIKVVLASTQEGWSWPVYCWFAQQSTSNQSEHIKRDKKQKKRDKTWERDKTRERKRERQREKERGRDRGRDRER